MEFDRINLIKIKQYNSENGFDATATGACGALASKVVNLVRVLLG